MTMMRGRSSQLRYVGCDSRYKIGMSNETPPVPETFSDVYRSFIHRCLQREPDERLDMAGWFCMMPLNVLDKVMRTKHVWSDDSVSQVIGCCFRFALRWIVAAPCSRDSMNAPYNSTYFGVVQRDSHLCLTLGASCCLCRERLSQGFSSEPFATSFRAQAASTVCIRLTSTYIA